MFHQHSNDDFHLEFLMLILMQMQQLYVVSMRYKIKIVVWYYYNVFLVELQ